MANLIPKITWKELTLVGDTTISNDTITNIPDTTGAEVGMEISGTGVPANATILAITATTIQISANATASNTGVTFTMFFLLEFEFPPEGDNLNETERGNTRKTKSTNGSTQHQFNFREEQLSPSFTFITEAIQGTTRIFMETHALKGNNFKYFESKDEASFRTMELDRFEYKPKRIIPNDTGGFTYDFSFRLRRTLT